MDLENRFWMYFWTLAAIVIIVAVIVCGYNYNVTSKLYEEMYSKCITENGTWIPTSYNNAICLRK